MTDPLTDEAELSLSAALGGLRSRTEVGVAAKHVEDFVRDVLSFYETQLIDGATKTNRSLRAFLADNNFSDASDPVFVVIPTTVTLRHYISLRQRLHQAKLSLLFCSTDLDSAMSVDAPNDTNAMTTTTRGRCWLWEDENILTANLNENESIEPPQSSSRDRWRLWFEHAMPGKEFAAFGSFAAEAVAADALMGDIPMEAEPVVADVQMDDVSADAADEPDQLEPDKDAPLNAIEAGIEDAKFLAARMLQRWWRREFEILANMDRIHFEDSDSEYGDDDVAEIAVDCPEDELFAVDTNNQALEHCSREIVDLSPTVSYMEITYETKDNEIHMRKWLDEHSLPQSVADALLKLGARCINAKKCWCRSTLIFCLSSRL